MNQQHLFPALFSLGLHGLVASFFIPSFLIPCAQMSVPIEVVWEMSQEKPSLATSPPKVKEKIAQSNHTAECCKKMKVSPPIKQNPCPSVESPEKGYQKQYLAKADSLLIPRRQAYQPLPKYPWISRKRRQEGVVALTIETNGDGQVIKANLHKSSGHTPLDESALETVKSWIFAEGSVQKTLSIAFRLKNLEGKLEGNV